MTRSSADALLGQGDTAVWDATNSVRLCVRCEAEQGITAGADARDRACAACGQHDAPHIYPALPLAQQLPQRQDALDDQLHDVARMAVLMGCYDAADWINHRKRSR